MVSYQRTTYVVFVHVYVWGGLWFGKLVGWLVGVWVRAGVGALVGWLFWLSWLICWSVSCLVVQYIPFARVKTENCLRKLQRDYTCIFAPGSVNTSRTVSFN